MDVLEIPARRGLRLGAIVGGLLVAVSVQFLLMMLGAAIGLTAWPAANVSNQTAQISFGAWLLGSLTVSMFIGSLVASLCARSPSGGDGLLHGLVTWAAIGLGGVFLVGRNVDAVVGGAIRVVGETAAATAPTPEAKRVIQENAADANTKVDNAVANVKQKLNEASTNLQAAGAAEETRQGLAVGLWGFLGVEMLLLVVALIGGAAGAGRERRWQRRQLLRARRPAVAPSLPVPVVERQPVVIAPHSTQPVT